MVKGGFLCFMNVIKEYSSCSNPDRKILTAKAIQTKY